MARAGRRGEYAQAGLTWRAGPPRRYDVALRPRGRTRVAHAGGAPSGREATRPRGRPCGRHVSRSREERLG